MSVGAPDAGTTSWPNRVARLVLKPWAASLTIAVVGIALWEGLVRGGVLDSFWFGQPSVMIERIKGWVEDGSLWTNIAVTMREALVGFAIASVAGILVGLLLAQRAFVEKTLRPFIVAANSLPRIALASLFILWFGIGELSKIALVISLVFFILLFNTLAAALDVDEDIITVVRTLGASQLELLAKVVLPACLPHIFSGLRLGMAYALTGAVVGEIVSSISGIGNLISRRAGLFDTSGVFAAILVLTVLALMIEVALATAERRLFKWRKRAEG